MYAYGNGYLRIILHQFEHMGIGFQVDGNTKHVLHAGSERAFYEERELAVVGCETYAIQVAVRIDQHHMV
jgi:hypothetical protein